VLKRFSYLRRGLKINWKFSLPTHFPEKKISHPDNTHEVPHAGETGIQDAYSDEVGR
jgi:hypothetical protein